MLFRPATDRQLEIALLILRLVLGGVMLVHGYQKLFVFGFAGVTGAFGRMDVPLPEVMGPLVALLEFFGGIALVAGLLTRLVAFGFALDMLGAILLVKSEGGFFNPNGIEFEMTLAGVALALVVAGAGRLSIDDAIARRRAPA